jgi:ABC-type antimicrobial peptide transport system ATPase subunit
MTDLMADLLVVDSLTTRIRTRRGVVTPVDGVSLRVPEGGAVGLVGESAEVADHCVPGLVTGAKTFGMDARYCKGQDIG